MNPKLLVLRCLTIILLLIPIAGATYDVVSGIASNSTEYTTTSSYTELHNISLATGDGTVFIKASWDARVNFTAPLYGRFMRDGVSLGRFNLTQSVYAQVGSYELALNETTGTHYYGWEVYSNKKGTLYSRNFSAVFLKNGTYGTGAGGGNVSSVTGAPAGVLDCTGTDEITCTISPQGTNFRNDTISTQGTLITALQVNDTYFNSTIFPNSTNFRNDSISGKLDISTYSGDYPNSSLINYLLINTYGDNYPNNSLSNYLLTSLFGTNFNTSFHAEIPVCNATTGKLVSEDGETVTCGTDQTGAAGGNVSSVTAQSPLTHTGTIDVIIKDERTTYPNDTISGNLDNWNVTYNATYDAKESAISQGVSPQFWMFNKTWQNITTSWLTEGVNLWFTNARAISAVQSILDTMNTSSDANNTASQGRDDAINNSVSALQINNTNDRIYVNTTFIKIANATTCTGTDKSVWNGTAFICGTDQNTGTSIGGGINVSGQPVITDNASLVQGANITLTQSGNNITIASVVGSQTVVTNQTIADGTTQNYTTPTAFLANSTRVYLNGLRQRITYSYTENTVTQTINFTGIPESGKVIEVEYVQS